MGHSGQNRSRQETGRDIYQFLEAVAFHCRVVFLSHLVIACDPAVVGLGGQHHVQLGLVRPSLALVPGVERQG